MGKKGPQKRGNQGGAKLVKREPKRAKRRPKRGQKGAKRRDKRGTKWRQKGSLKEGTKRGIRGAIGSHWWLFVFTGDHMTCHDLL